MTKWTDSEDCYRGGKKQSINKMLNVWELSSPIGLILESTMDGMHKPQRSVSDNSEEI